MEQQGHRSLRGNGTTMTLTAVRGWNSNTLLAMREWNSNNNDSYEGMELQ